MIYHGLEVLGGGSILAGLILGAIGVFVIERDFVKASAFALAGAVLTYFGFMHGEAVGIGGGFGVTPAVALAYAVVAAGLFALSRVETSAHYVCASGHADGGAGGITFRELRTRRRAGRRRVRQNLRRYAARSSSRGEPRSSTLRPLGVRTGTAVARLGKPERGKIFDDKSIQRASLRGGRTQRLQHLPLIRREIVIEFRVHAASNALVTFARVLQSEHEGRATIMSPEFVQHAFDKIARLELIELRFFAFAVRSKSPVTRLSQQRVNGGYRPSRIRRQRKLMPFPIG